MVILVRILFLFEFLIHALLIMVVLKNRFSCFYYLRLGIMLLDFVCICIYIGDWLLGNGLVGVFSYLFCFDACSMQV